MKAKIEQSMLERLRLGLPSAVRLALYNGELADYTTAIRTLPAVWLRWTGSGVPQTKDTARTRLVTPNTFAVVVAGRSLTPTGATHGTAQTLGAYALLDDAVALLDGHDFGLDGVAPMQPGAARTLMASQGVVVLSQDLTTLIQTRRRPPNQRPAPFTPAEGDTDHPAIPAPTTPGWNWEAEHSPLPPPEAPPLQRIGLNYHCPPTATDPVLRDELTLQGDLDHG